MSFLTFFLIIYHDHLRCLMTFQFATIDLHRLQLHIGVGLHEAPVTNHCLVVCQILMCVQICHSCWRYDVSYPKIIWRCKVSQIYPRCHKMDHTGACRSKFQRQYDTDLSQTESLEVHMSVFCGILCKHYRGHGCEVHIPVLLVIQGHSNL